MHPLFKALQQAALSPEIEQLLTTREGYAPLFLAAGWYEAALSLHEMQKLPASFPRWVAYGLTQAIALNRSPEHALLFAQSQIPSPQLNLLIGELALRTGKFDEAIQALSPLATSSSEVGVRAASLLAFLLAEQARYTQACQIVRSNAPFAQSVKGQELLARLAIQLGRLDEAEAIYNSILKNSAQAKSFIATRAFQNQEYDLALQLTQELLHQYPHRHDLLEQLALIQNHLTAPKS
jgi:tetratricopeptide (TPR) repeat protein